MGVDLVQGHLFEGTSRSRNLAFRRLAYFVWFRLVAFDGFRQQICLSGGAVGNAFHEFTCRLLNDGLGSGRRGQLPVIRSAEGNSTLESRNRVRCSR